jgi:hypothetical protein
MPYYVYRIRPGRQFELADTFPGYREARDRAREMRAGIESGDEYTVKVMFAKSPEEAERLMSEVREPRPLGEDA